jgi:hypothetical protein
MGRTVGMAAWGLAVALTVAVAAIRGGRGIGPTGRVPTTGPGPRCRTGTGG